MTKIMIVEDSSLMRAVITNFIRKEYSDIEIVEAHDGLQAIDVYKKERPNLVFMDIKMPGMDGMTAFEKIHEFDSSAKVVMCTSLKEPEQEKKAIELGAKGYIKKPFSHEDIINAIKENIV